jgi:hypothetical protein
MFKLKDMKPTAFLSNPEIKRSIQVKNGNNIPLGYLKKIIIKMSSKGSGFLLYYVADK